MLLFICSLIMVTASGVTAFMLLTSGSLEKFKQIFSSTQAVPTFPIVTNDGTLVGSKDELEAHLDILKDKFNAKISDIQESKTKIDDAQESIEQLMLTQQQIKCYYITLKEAIKKSEDDCIALRKQIDEYKTKKRVLERNAKPKRTKRNPNSDEAME